MAFEYISLRKLRKSEGESNWSQEADESVNRRIISASVGPSKLHIGLVRSSDYDGVYRPLTQS